jgi:hypothetical protein
MGWFSDIFGGSQASTTSAPSWSTDQAKKIIDVSNRASQVGYVPFQGGEIAGFNPQQLSAMRNVGDRFSQFNKTAPTEPDIMPQTDFGGGMHGYSSFPGFQQQMTALEKMYPGMAAMLRGFQKNPYGAGGAPGSGWAGQPPGAPGAPVPRPPHSPKSSNLGFGDRDGSHGGGERDTSGRGSKAFNGTTRSLDGRGSYNSNTSGGYSGNWGGAGRV